MSSNPLMAGYEGGDLLLIGAAWPMVGLLPKPVCAGCGRWPGWPAALVSDESALEEAIQRCAIQIDILPFTFYPRMLGFLPLARRHSRSASLNPWHRLRSCCI